MWRRGVPASHGADIHPVCTLLGVMSGKHAGAGISVLIVLLYIDTVNDCTYVAYGKQPGAFYWQPYSHLLEWRQVCQPVGHTPFHTLC